MSPTALQAIDEHMVKFKGQHAMKKYMPMKPIKRGFKMWCRNDFASGYLFQCDIYGGVACRASHLIELACQNLIVFSLLVCFRRLDTSLPPMCVILIVYCKSCVG